MPSSTALVGAGTVALSAAISTWLAVYAARRRDVPGAPSLALFGASVAVWAAAYAGGLLTYDPVWRPVWEQLAWVGRATVGVWFLLFALAYTGHDGVVTRRRIGGLLVVSVTTITLVWTNGWHELIWAGQQTVRVEFGMALVISKVGPAFWTSVAYTYLIVRLIPWSDYLYVDQSALLLIGIAAPFAGSAFTVLPPHPILGFDYTPYAFAVTGLTFGYALFRRQLFELVPATRLLGSNPAISQLDNGVLVLDGDRRIVYGRTVYGAIGLSTARTVGDRERAVLGELGEMVGHAVNATETRQLLAGDSVVELELRRDGGADPFAVAADDADCRLELAGVVPSEDDAAVYLRAKDGDVAAVVDGLAAAPGSAGARGDDTNLVDYRPDSAGLLGTVLDWSVNVTGMTVDGRRATYELGVTSETTARSLVTHLEERFPDVTLESKRVRESVPRRWLLIGRLPGLSPQSN